MTIYTTNKPSACVRALTAIDTLCSLFLIILAVIFFIGLAIKPAHAAPVDTPTTYSYIDTTAEKSEWDARTAVCDRTDTIIGVGVGIATGIAATIGTVAGMTLVGPGIAAGATVGVARAVAMPFLKGTTLPMAAGMIPTIGGLAGVLGYSASCVSRNYVNEMY